jgi:hypothetical protein
MYDIVQKQQESDRLRGVLPAERCSHVRLIPEISGMGMTGTVPHILDRSDQEPVAAVTVAQWYLRFNGSFGPVGLAGRVISLLTASISMRRLSRSMPCKEHGGERR